jgi:stage V sporulation protein AD
MALGKAELKPEDIDMLYAGDLLGQSIASSFGVSIYHIPHIGLYGACSTCGEALALGAMSVSAGFAQHVACVTSSHFASAEKEFRYPLDYGSQRPLSANWTVTGSGAFILSDEQQKARALISNLTFGKIIDFGIKDSLNMGVCMAPAAADTIERHLKYYHELPEAYDKIITGDLGKVGQQALIDLLRERDIDISAVHMDCGIEIFDEATQDTHAGGSGCGCSAVTLAAYILKQLESGTWKRVLFLPTGALLSKTSFNEGQTVPGIAHGVVINAID